MASWRSVWQPTDPEAADEEDSLDAVVWAGTRFAVSGVDFEGCAEEVEGCNRSLFLISPDRVTWTEPDGPDGVAGPDPGTFVSDVASNGEVTVVLGGTGDGSTLAWLMPPAPAASG